MLSDINFAFPRLAALMIWLAIVLVTSTAGAVVAERALFFVGEARRRRFEARYVPLVRAALADDLGAQRDLVASPRRDRLGIATLLIAPLIDNRDPLRIARVREFIASIQLAGYANRLVASRLWWRRALGLRALGLLQAVDRTPLVVAALDDRNVDVRAAALDALADLRDPSSLPAIVVRLHDSSLPRGRRAAALAAFGAAAEPMLLDLSAVDSHNRVKYARALGICGTAASRPTLREWAAEAATEVRSAAYDALASIGLDAEAARLAIAALEDADPGVRAAAARALKGWSGASEAAPRLARHLDDTWAVAMPAARALQSMGDAGIVELRAFAVRTDLAGTLARQMLWEAHLPC
jgi:HEAT repeat protein